MKAKMLGGAGPDHRELLRRIDRYLDAVPRAVVRTEGIGPFTLFVNEGRGWRYYARPTPGATVFTPEDVHAVRERQRALDQPEEIEWVTELSPGVGPAVEGAGMRPLGHPLMHLPLDGFTPIEAPAGVEVMLVAPQGDLALMNAVANIAFAAPGTSVHLNDGSALDAAVAAADPDTIAFTRERLADGFTVMAMAKVEGDPVAVGSFQSTDGAAEITGVATLPGFRRRGIGAALTSYLASEAFARGVEVIFLSADSHDVARVYGRLGFVTIGSVGAAEVVES
jgi:ribosomal protein S18 acetylase RimI-like enzyme